MKALPERGREMIWISHAIRVLYIYLCIFTMYMDAMGIIRVSTDSFRQWWFVNIVDKVVIFVPSISPFYPEKVPGHIGSSKSSGCAKRMGLLSSSKIWRVEAAGSKLKMIDTPLKIGMQQIMTPNLPRCWYPNFVIQKKTKNIWLAGKFLAESLIR